MVHDPPAAHEITHHHESDVLRHDVKTILTTMRLQTQLMLRHVRRQPAPDRTRLVHGLSRLDAAISQLDERIDQERA